MVVPTDTGRSAPRPRRWPPNRPCKPSRP